MRFRLLLLAGLGLALPGLAYAQTPVITVTSNAGADQKTIVNGADCLGDEPEPGFLVSIEVFREIRVPFTGIRLSTRRREAPSVVESAADAGPGRPVAAAGERASKASTPH